MSKLTKRMREKVGRVATRSKPGGKYSQSLLRISEKLGDTQWQIHEDQELIEGLLAVDWGKVAGHDLATLKGELDKLARGTEKIQEALFEIYFSDRIRSKLTASLAKYQPARSLLEGP